MFSLVVIQSNTQLFAPVYLLLKEAYLFGQQMMWSLDVGFPIFSLALIIFPSKVQ